MQRLSSRPSSLALYPTFAEFALTYKPQNIAAFCSGNDRALRCVETTTAPTLREIAETYNRDRAVVWVMSFLYDLSETAGCRDKISDRACEEAATFILTERLHYRATELMLFFWRCKFGEFGTFYGSVDIQKLGSWLRQFDRYINTIIGQNEKAQTRH